MQKAMTLDAALVHELKARLGYCHDRIKHCVNQLDDRQVWWRPTDEMNSIGNILLHLCGNVQQWMIHGIVGNGPDDRNRAQEFAERTIIPKAELFKKLDDVVAGALRVFESLSAKQFLEPRHIQGFDETVLSAILNSLTHFNGHTQEIIYITRLQLGPKYQYAWAPATFEQGAAP
jgi:hypothetical protein